MSALGKGGVKHYHFPRDTISQSRVFYVISSFFAMNAVSGITDTSPF